MANRDERTEEQSGVRYPNGPLWTAEMLRTAAASYKPETPAKAEDRVPIIWRIFGGTLLSIVALVAITIYQQFSAALSELKTDIGRLNESRVDLVRKHEINDLRGDLNRFHENRGDLIKKDEFNSRVLEVWNGIRELQAANLAQAASRERAALLEQQVKAGEEERKELARELQKLRERLAVVEGRQGTGSGEKPPEKPE